MGPTMLVSGRVANRVPTGAGMTDRLIPHPCVHARPGPSCREERPGHPDWWINTFRASSLRRYGVTSAAVAGIGSPSAGHGLLAPMEGAARPVALPERRRV